MKTLRRARCTPFGLATALSFAILALAPSPAQAQAAFSATDITWDVVGLDSNNVNVGPNHFPIGTRVCNTGNAPAFDVEATYIWDSTNPYINLRAGTATTLPVAPTVIDLDPGECTDFFYEVEITRDPGAYDTSRRYHVALTANGGATTGSTDVPREVFVEHIISQSRNYVLDMQVTPAGGSFTSVPPGGTMTLLVGAEYDIRLVASTATNGYEQIETFINFPNIIFQILDVDTTYSAESSATMVPTNGPCNLAPGPAPICTYDALYGDGCIWEDDPLNPNYRSCLDVGKAGGDMTVTYRVLILSVPTLPLVNPEPLSTLIHDFSGSSYHYNADYGVQTRYAYILDPSTLDLTKSFVPSTTAPAGTSVLTIQIPNPTSGVLSGVNFIDPLPTSPAAMVVAATPNATTLGCGTPTFAPTAGSNTLQFSGGTIAANSTCVITVNVTAPSVGTYTNTTNNLFINGTTPGTGTDTGNNASAVLTVADNGTLCIDGQTLAQWTVPLTATNPPDTTGGVASIVSANVGTATASALTPADTSIVAGSITNAWSITHFRDAPLNTLQFVVDTSNYSNVAMTWRWNHPSPANGPETGSVVASAGGSGSVSITPPGAAGWVAGPIISGLTTNTGGTTTFTINLSGANANSASLVFDDITFTGCSYAPPPQITKSFAPDPIAVGATSVLTFNITNPGGNGYDPMNLSNVSFTDTLPAGLLVATPSGLTGSCGGGTITAEADSDEISLTGASLAANGSCSFSVNVLGVTAGLHQNVSGFISATESGTNTTSTGYATDTLLVIAPPSIAKAFEVSTIAVGNTTSLTFTITNPNVSTALTGVAFSDTLPAGLILATPVNLVGDCNGTIPSTSGGNTVTLSGATLPALGSCSFSVDVEGTTAGTKLNSTNNVTSTNGGTGNIATATLLVTAPNPAIALLKQVGPTASGPWSSFLSTVVGDPVYYRLTIENSGDVDLSPVTVTDPASWVDLSSCTWPATLSVGPAVLPAVDTATCIVGPIAGGAVDGSHPNTATAFGTYGSTTVTDTSTATYSTNQLTLVKAVDAILFDSAGDTLNYSYGVTNTGNVLLTGPITITDDKATVSCPPGDLAVGATIVCTASYVTTAGDVTAGQVTNLATAHALANAPPVSSNTATKTVPYLGAIDLAILKIDGAIRVETGSTTVYTILILNNGPAADGATLSDPAVTGLTKQTIDSCTAFGGAVCPVIGAGAGNLNIGNLEAGTVAIPSLPNGGSLSITMTVLVTSRNEPLVPVINVATVTKVSGLLTEFDLSNNTDDDPNFVAHNWGHLPADIYPTMNLYSMQGAFTLSGPTYLGASKLTDVDGINTGTYTVKPTDDGVTWTPAVPWTEGDPVDGDGGSVDVTVTCPVEPCYLNAWIDWNADGSFAEPGDKLFADNLSVVDGLQTLTFSIPVGASLDGTTLYSRFRLTDEPMTAPLPTGAALNGTNPLIGEIEDPFFQVNNGVTTPVTLASFEARRNGRYVDFEWTTATESGNVGFDIYVHQGKRLVAVNAELIPSQAVDSLDRRHYSFSAAVEGDTFFIEDVSISGEVRLHGPFRVDESFGGELVEEKVQWQAIRREHESLRTARRESGLREMRAAPRAQTVSLEVRKSGIQRVTYEALVAAGVDPSVGLDRFYLTHRGVAQPIYSQVRNLVPGTFFEFYGEALDTTYTDTNVYELKVGGRGSAAIREANGAPSAVPVPPASYTETFVLNRQLGYANYAPANEAWYDTSMLAFTTPQSWAYPFQLDAVADSSEAAAEVVIWGVTDWPQSPDHHVVASVNGVEVADATFDGLIEQRWTVDLPAGTLQNGLNTLDLALPGDTGAGWDLVNFDQLRLTYERGFAARDGRLTFTGEAQDFEVTNLPSKNVVVYRLGEQGLRRLRDVRVEWNGSSYRATFAGGGREATFFVSTFEALHAPGIELARPPVDLDVDAEYLVISHPGFIAGLQPLIQAREAQGLTVNVVDVNDVYAQYSYGVFDPQAIRDYIAHAAAELGTRSVLLVGGDTYDYRNYLGGGSVSFIPSLYASTGQFVRFVPSDTLYVDLGAAGVPSLAIGRFPVRTNAELDTIVAKTLAYEQKIYGRTAFFAADRTDNGVSFKGINAGFMQGLPAGWSSDSVDLDDSDVPTAQAGLIAAMNGGTALVTFTGHSGPREWTFSHLFTTSHAAALTNAGQPFVVVQWGCWNTYHVDPVNNYLVHSFLFGGDRGAAAVLGATTLTDSSSEQLLGALLTPRLVVSGMTIGQALLEAKQELATTHPELADVLIGWSLMGDPALVVEP